MRYLGACMDEYSLLFVLTDSWKPESCNESPLTALVQYLVQHFYKSVEIVDRKVASRHLKSIWISLNACELAAAELLWNSKQKNFYRVFPHLTQLIKPETANSVSVEILQIVVLHAIQFHKKKDLESLQIAKIISELFALICYSDKQNILV